jgi:hypothetical protein
MRILGNKYISDVPTYLTPHLSETDYSEHWGIDTERNAPSFPLW